MDNKKWTPTKADIWFVKGVIVILLAMAVYAFVNKQIENHQAKQEHEEFKRRHRLY